MEQKQSTQVKKLLFDIKRKNQRKNKKIIVYGFPFILAFIALLIFYFPQNPGSGKSELKKKAVDKNQVYLDQQRFFKQYTRFLRRKHGAILHTKEMRQVSIRQKGQISSYTTFLLEFRVFDEKLFFSTTQRYSELFNTRLKIRSKAIHLESTAFNYAYEISFIKKSKLFIKITVPYKNVIKKKVTLPIDPPQKIQKSLQGFKEEKPRIQKTINNTDEQILQKTDRLEEESISEEEIYESEREEENTTGEESTIDESEPEAEDYEHIDEVENENFPLEEAYEEEIPETEVEEIYEEEIPETEESEEFLDEGLEENRELENSAPGQDQVEEPHNEISTATEENVLIHTEENVQEELENTSLSQEIDP